MRDDQVRKNLSQMEALERVRELAAVVVNQNSSSEKNDNRGSIVEVVDQSLRKHNLKLSGMSQQLVFDLFRNTLEAADILGEGDFAARLKPYLNDLDPGLRIGSWGQLQEWQADLDQQDDHHRHISHLFALHPGRQVSPAATPELAQAAETTLNARGDAGTGWSKAWKINMWARLLDGDRAHKLLTEQLKHSTLPNLWDNHPPFQIDGNFGATAGVAEMLVQSHLGEIHLLPALPGSWPEGEVFGLKARGNHQVDIRWRDGVLASATIAAGRDGEIRVRTNSPATNYSLLDKASGRKVAVVIADNTLRFNAEKNRRYQLIRR